jgi:hypothetical protein
MHRLTALAGRNGPNCRPFVMERARGCKGSIARSCRNRQCPQRHLPMICRLRGHKGFEQVFRVGPYQIKIKVRRQRAVLHHRWCALLCARHLALGSRLHCIWHVEFYRRERTGHVWLRDMARRWRRVMRIAASCMQSLVACERILSSEGTFALFAYKWTGSRIFSSLCQFKVL